MRNLSSTPRQQKREIPRYTRNDEPHVFCSRFENTGHGARNTRIKIIRESHDTPESVARILTRAGGANRFAEPNYRAIWGWNRLAWIGGKFEDRDDHGALLRERVELRYEPKYPQLNRWHIERWLPPEAYGCPRQWHAQTTERAGAQSVPALGPYPSRGDYEHCFTLETPRGEFLQLTATIAEHIARAIECSRGARAAHSRTQSRAKLYERELREDRAYSDWAYDLLDDAVPAFHHQPFVAVT